MRFPKILIPALGVLLCLSLIYFLRPHHHVAKARTTFGVTFETPREFPQITNLDQWKSRAQMVRQQILVSAGLWPMPKKTPLNAHIFGKITRDDYSVEKVYFETYPGVYLCGNLYRPLGKGNGPFPAITNPHGHWDHGRLEDTETVSIAGRCINFARQGMVAFSYDMEGYNDTRFGDTPPQDDFYTAHVHFTAHNPAAQLWGISLMGLQTWNSIRALDFLESLPDVDTNRLAVTGASGGGTQTFMVGAVDDRLAAQAPVVMVSHSMQGGCLCENMPGLRVEFSNMEIAATAAPRPQIMVGASGDWTKTMLTIEGPAVERIYQFFDAEQNLRYARFESWHNYNRKSREAVYRWFDARLLGKPDAPVKELDYKKEPDADLRVFPHGKMPANAISEQGLIDYLIELHKKELRDIEPTNEASLGSYQQFIRSAWDRTLQINPPAVSPNYSNNNVMESADYMIQRLTITSSGHSHPPTAFYFTPTKTNDVSQSTIIVIGHDDGMEKYVAADNTPGDLTRRLLDRHWSVIVPENPPFHTNDEHDILFTTYNRTRLQDQTRRLEAFCSIARNLESGNHRVVLLGAGQAAYWAMLDAQCADAVAADCDQLDVSDDKNLLAPGLFCPCLRNIDSFNGPLILAAPHPLLLHNVSPKYPGDELETAYKISRQESRLKIEPKRLSDDEVMDWIAQLDRR